jgi:hypothetical protein
MDAPMKRGRFGLDLGGGLVHGLAPLSSSAGLRSRDHPIA